jgi:hypothetical protein
MARTETRIGKGIYSVAEASLLSRVPQRRIRRWLQGYEYKIAGQRRTSSPVLRRDFDSPDGILSLSFLDLLEVRFVNEFRQQGVSWNTIRVASQRAVEVLGHDHPFSTKRFRTDGKTILLEIAQEAEEAALLDLVRDQYAFRRIVAPFLKGVEFGPEDVARRWWPMNRRNAVVLDPARAFGQPIVHREGVPTLHRCSR